jgi:hypothetical protein
MWVFWLDWLWLIYWIKKFYFYDKKNIFNDKTYFNYIHSKKEIKALRSLLIIVNMFLVYNVLSFDILQTISS